MPIISIVEDLKALTDWEDRYTAIIDFAKHLPSISESQKIEKYKISGCQSRVWLIPEFHPQNNQLFFLADSDSLLVKGLVGVMLEKCNGLSPAQILEITPDFLDELGFLKNLSQVRANGLQATFNQIQKYAKSFNFVD